MGVLPKKNILMQKITTEGVATVASILARAFLEDPTTNGMVFAKQCQFQLTSNLSMMGMWRDPQ